MSIGRNRMEFKEIKPDGLKMNKKGIGRNRMEFKVESGISMPHALVKYR